jgi:hypothetical protein
MEVSTVTSLISWYGTDPHGVTSMYIASDSQVTYANANGIIVNKEHRRKVFWATATRDIFGYCGSADAEFTLDALCVELESGQHWTAETPAADRANRVVQYLNSFCKRSTLPLRILHGSAVGHRRRDMVFSHFEYVQDGGCISYQKHPIALGAPSGVLAIRGSGNTPVSTAVLDWDRSEHGRTSRAIFSAFCDAIASHSDPYTGGAPQLVGLFARGTVEPHGVLYNEAAFFQGVEIKGASDRIALGIEWRNPLFERCAPDTLARVLGAQRHCRPI